jgi:homospermidine synthase
MTEGKNKIVMLGFGNIGQAIIPLLTRHFADRTIHVFEQRLSTGQAEIVREHGLLAIEDRITRQNYVEVLTPLLEAGDFLLNLATSISSKDLIALAQSRGALYIDSCIDPWEYSHSEKGIDTSNYQLREQLLEARRASADKPTAIVAHGANPGFVSILVKHGLLMMASAHGVAHAESMDRDAWGRLARDLDIRVMQISERDTQVSMQPRALGEFVSTWSVEGFVTECLQPAELGWGTHERDLPPGGRRHDYGCQAAIYIDRPGFTMRVKSWSPNNLDFDAFMITHNEAISLADYFTYHEDGQVVYRPTSYYAYHPCDDAVDSVSLLRARTADEITSTRVLKDEIVSGIDELGVFLISKKYPSLWLGSNLSIGKARKQAPYNNATSLQVVSSIVAAMSWMRENPNRGILESEDLDHQFIFDFTRPYWSPMVAEHVTWKPRPGADELLFADFQITAAQ